MGRKKIEPEEKKIKITLSVKRKYVDWLKINNFNIGKIIEDFVKKHQK